LIFFNHDESCHGGPLLGIEGGLPGAMTLWRHG
jgi:hypothetical protein